jgi:hypothetical protein
MSRHQVLCFFVAAIGLFLFLDTSASAQVCEPDNFAAGTLTCPQEWNQSLS